MLTNNKIVTVEDLKACCLHEMKNKIDHEIRIQRGLVTGLGNKEGFVRCVEVTLKKDTAFMQENPQHNWLEEQHLLQSKIAQRSSLNLTVRIHII